ncbi:ShlB/FhaC/HecB family hemolysin secretion/activation protein [Pseudomonas putida]|uniref:ShlB/FhaC/HecB family hemolysin secretion/activation protein n=1 Tax=Pseudomonas putida TaxID=303 RepID=A0A4D6XNL7_PSEPU|nr:ShlB/FhaC/HecB family hemolysin secretion/activation protein [Pseudomonas putida]QCI14375.1 ShlB/FhaC/HecB family hemolysin secretion/activation protein [Pseudomonas putida]
MPSRFCRFASSLLACCLAALLPVPAALGDDPASQQLRDQQHSQQQLEQQLRLQRWQRAPTQQPPDQPPAQMPITGHCWAVTGVRLAGNHRLTARVLESGIRSQLRPCLGVDDLNQLLKAITRLYVEAGYPTSRPYLSQPPQDDQPLDIVVVEGFVESIEMGAELPLWLQGAFPDLLGQPLYLPALEQGLDQLNRLRAFELSADLLPGTLTGATRVSVQAQQVASRWHLDSRFDNRGSSLTGRHRLNLGLGLDSPLGLNDDLRLGLSSTVLDAPGRSQGLSLYYSLPYGFWTFAVSASQLSYQAPIPQKHRMSHGSSSFQGVSAERVIWRNQQGMLSASARLDRKQLLNRIGKTEIKLQSPTLTSLEAGINLLWLEHGLWHGFVGVARGVDWFGADQSPLHEDAPRPDFLKYRANLLHLRQGPANRPWRWQSELSLQYSRDPLPAAEQLLLSDDSTVRGFRLSSYSGSSGAVWRNTFSQALTLPQAQPLQVRPYIGLDMGWTRPLQAKHTQHLVGAAAGVELSLPSSRLRLDYQRALHANDTPRPRLESGFWVMEWTFSL